MSGRLFLLVGLSLIGVLAAAPAASAVTCGEADPDAKPPSTRPVRATLALDEKTSRTTLAFKRTTGHQGISLVFNATGCDLPTSPSEPTVQVLTKAGSTDLPDGTLSVKQVTADSPEYVVKVDVDAKKFDPGSYDGQIVLRAPYLASNHTPISVSRSEDRWWIPVLIGALGGLASLVWYAMLKSASGAELATDNALLLAGVVVACLVAGIVAVLISYLNQDVWKLGDNWWSAVAAAFTGATTGATVGLLGDIWKVPADGDG